MSLTTIADLIFAHTIELSLTLATVSYVLAVVNIAKWIGHHEEWIPDMSDDNNEQEI